MVKAIEDFFSAWGLGGSDAGNELIEGAVAPSFSYSDPRTPAAITTLTDLGAYVANFPQGMSPEIQGIDLTDVYARATVKFGEQGGKPMLGQYFCELDGDKRLTRIVGFMGTGV